MIRIPLLLALVSLLSACGAPASPEDAPEPVAAEAMTVTENTLSAAAAMDVDNNVMINVARLIPEDDACLVMMNVANGTDQTVTAGLFAFDVTGNGETAGANMFPQTTEPGEVVTAQIILPGADCENAEVIEGGQINCRFAESGESCIETLELRDGVVDFTLND